MWFWVRIHLYDYRVYQELSSHSIILGSLAFCGTSGLELTQMQRIVCVVALIFQIILPAAYSQSRPQPAEKVWFWFGDCTAPRLMGVQLLLDGKPIYQSRFRACQMSRTTANSQREQEVRSSFHFSGGHTFQGTYRTSKTETIEGTLWQAGADPDEILLGIAFQTHDQVLINTIHISKLGKPAESKLDQGLVIKTYPLK
jgi:hypothetical protein